MLEKELEIAVNLAREAGRIILDFYATDFEIEVKIFADNFSEPVTVADRAASRIIVEALAAVFPDDGVLSEEEFDDRERLTKQRVWIIDPLDGTQGFVDRNGDFAVQIGLAENGESVLGVVFLPSENVLYYARKGDGAWLAQNGKTPERMQVSGKTDFAEMNLATSRNHRSAGMSRVFERFGLNAETQRGSVGLKIGLITRQICDLYVHLSPRTKHWDTCAPEIILTEAGGEMTDLFGEKIIYNTPDVHNYNGVLATNGGATHSRAVKSLRPLLNEFGRPRVKSAGRI
jgi:3'(2'), 5'-bisphosphate nucleotidase